jgi:D-amino peptidase
MFIGYHSSAGRAGNPMAHTVSGNHVYIKVNGIIASEFLLYSYACALEGVPTVFLSGDEMLCEDFKDLHPNLITCAVKDGMGAMTRNYSPEDTLKWIKEKSEKSLKQDLSKALVKLPETFEIEIYFKEIQHAEKVSWFPGVDKVSDNIVRFSSDSYFEVLRTIRWII